jgi:hypothetical protein
MATIALLLVLKGIMVIKEKQEAIENDKAI